jgi:hypothetical protein
MIKYLVMALGVLASTAVSGQSLEDRFRDIERRLSVVESQRANQAAAAAAAAAPASQAQSVAGPEKWKRQESWRLLRRGMSNPEVKAILGEPTKIDPGPIWVWHYGPQSRVYWANERLDAWTAPGR